MLVDSHCHLDFPDFADDLDAIVERAGAAGVGRIVTISTRVRQFDRLLAIAERFSNVYCSVGTHPHNAHEELDLSVEDLSRAAAIPRWWPSARPGSTITTISARATPRRPAFAATSRRRARPACRWSSIRAKPTPTWRGFSTEETGKGAFPAVLHCFTAGPDLARTAIALGLHISFTGILTFKRSDELRAIAASLPADRIMVETDSPYLAPGKFRGKRNEPAYVVEVAKVLAATRGVSTEEIARQTTENFFRLFNKVPRSSAAAA